MNSPSANVPSRSGLRRLRLIIRRLPPGLTQGEFEDILGSEWRVGGGKVDWFAYKDGKISKDSAKPSRPARAYLRVKDQGMLDTLSAAVKQCNFQDAKNTSKDLCLLGPPSLEFAPYGRVPGSRVRKDGRQGTIDQDPEFIDFLQSLTEPVTRYNVNGEGLEGADTKPAKINTTPLVEYLKEKKANKAKEGAMPKSAKSQSKLEAKEAKETKPEKADSKKLPVAKREAQKLSEKVQIEKATHDNVKGVTKSVAISKSQSETSESATTLPKSPATTSAPIKRERERGSASVAAKILQRDLGLVLPRSERRISRGGAVATTSTGRPATESKKVAEPVQKQSSDKVEEAKSSDAATVRNLSSTNAPIAPTDPPTGPRSSKTPMPTSQLANRPVTTPPARPSRPASNPSPGAKSAFLKHANLSQGVTEDLLLKVFSTFGAVTRCEIDRKKGFGYVDFEDPESLKKAMLASPVKVGEKGGQVVVLENKNLRSKPQAPVQQSAPREVIVTAQLPNAPTISPGPEKVKAAPTAPAATTAPIAPRGAHAPFRGGVQHHSPRGGYAGPPRGGYSRAGRGGRANYRGRGAVESNQGDGHTHGKNTNSPVSTPEPATPVAAATLVVEANKNKPTG